MERKKIISQAQLQAKASDGRTDYRFDVGLYIFKENGVYVIYSPAFDLSTSSDSLEGAVPAFYEAFQLHIEYCIEHNTLIEDLKEHGWKVVNKAIKEPTAQQLLNSPSMSGILSGRFNYHYVVSSISIPAYAL